MERDRVLVIDDDPDFRELVVVCACGWGLTCLEACDCASALALVDRERGRLSAVLLDYFMPGLDPRVCAASLRARVDPSTRVALVSAAVDIGERASELGLTRYLAKPFDLAELRDLLCC